MQQRSLFFACFILIAAFLHAETVHSRLTLESAITAGLPEGIPRWLYRNSSGLVDDGNFSSYYLLDADAAYQGRDGLLFETGASAAMMFSSESRVFLPQIYARLLWRGWYLLAGRKIHTIGICDDELSSGSMVVSGNAPPVPKIAFGTDGFWTVPYTRGWAEVMGMISHGWLEKDRYVASPWLHEKNAYLRIGPPGILNVYAGLVHEAVWAGTSPDHGDLPDDFSDYLLVFFNKSGDEDAPAIDSSYRLGNSVGIWDFGVQLYLPGYDVHGYYQHYFEDKTGFWYFRNKYDGLWGLSLRKEEPWYIDGLLYEFLYTMSQSGDTSWDNGGGRDSYYEHGLYRSGWTYMGRILGNPLFDSIDTEERTSIINSRIIGHHLGIKGTINTEMAYKILATYSRNYGTYGNRFPEPLDLYSFSAEWTWNNAFSNDQLGMTAAIGSDFGDYTEWTIGGKIVFTYRYF